MKISPTKFVVIFLVSAFAFQFITNSLLGPDVRPFPENGDWFPEAAFSTGWKHTVATIIYPVKIVLVGPLSLVLNDPDPAPPIRGLGVAIYWSLLATSIYFILIKSIVRKKSGTEL